MELKNIHTFYFLGIGGIGMSALARYFNAAGNKIYGYDKTATKLTDELISEDIDIHFESDVKFISNHFDSQKRSEILIVYTPAVPKDFAELIYFKEHNFELVKRSELLGLITKNAFTIAVAGTHGKTTTSSLIAHILKTANIDCTAFLGGITQNYNTNLLLSSSLKTENKSTSKEAIVVVEADEYDRSFLTLHPNVAVITSVDADHLDIYGDVKEMEESYALFANQINAEGVLITKKNVQEKIQYANAVLTYSVNDKTDYYTKNLSLEKGFYSYDVVCQNQTIENITLGIHGKHNVENSIAAVAAARQLKISDVDIKKALSTFKGVKRRFEYIIQTEKLIFIDDYAHHPEELKACINSVKAIYPDKKITGVFQPHLYSRTRDFAEEFAKSLSLLDEVILLEIYPARELPMEGVTSKMLLDKINVLQKNIFSKAELVNEIEKRKPEVLLTLGAGDIDMLIEPIKKRLLKN
ncbi:MAG: UDP-N-acetylmuramate--L-alanine ligase [Bacteroidia bacterium]